MSNPDPVDIDLARYHATLDADEAFDAWMQERKQEQATFAENAMSRSANWDWDSATYILVTTSGVPRTAEDVLIEALDNSKEARNAYAELMASPAALVLRQLLAEHWANEMWETRPCSEINAAFAAEREALND